MPLDFKIERESKDETALVLPYEQNFDDGRTNHGFLDMRGRPDLAAGVAEAVRSPALTELLVALAQPGAKYFSIGCDLGAWPPPEPGDLHQAGGYIQLAFSDLEREATHHRRQMLFGRALEAHLQRAVGADSWVVRFTIAIVNAADLGGPEQVWSLVIEFAALAETNDEANASKERLLRVLRDFASPGGAMQ
jgi:hypothetical protein